MTTTTVTDDPPNRNSLKLGTIDTLVDVLTTAVDSGAATPLGRWFDGRIVGVLATPDDATSEHVAVGVSALPPGAAAPEHSHVAEEIAIVLSGSGQIIIDGEPIEVGRGDVIRTPSNSPHTTIASPDTSLTILWIYAPAGSEARWLSTTDNEEAP